MTNNGRFNFNEEHEKELFELIGKKDIELIECEKIRRKYLFDLWHLDYMTKKVDWLEKVIEIVYPIIV